MKHLSDFSEWTSLEAAFILGKLFYGDLYAELKSFIVYYLSCCLKAKFMVSRLVFLLNHWRMDLGFLILLSSIKLRLVS